MKKPDRKLKQIITLTTDKKGSYDIVITLMIPLETLLKKGYIR